MLFDATGILFKLIVSVVVLLVYMHFLGKLRPMSAMDQASNIVLGGIVSGAIYNSSLNILEFILIICAWSILVLLVKAAKDRSLVARDLIDGQPVLLVRNGKVSTVAFRKSHLSARDFIAMMHKAQVTTLADVRNVWLERSGELTISRKDEEGVAVTLIEDGKVVEANLRRLNQDSEWLKERLAEKGLGDPKTLFYAEWNRDGLTACPYDDNDGEDE